MSTIGKYSFLLINTLFAVFILAWPVFQIRTNFGDNKSHFYLAVILCTGLFLEVAAHHNKGIHIFRNDSEGTVPVPGIFKVLFLLRIPLAGYIGMVLMEGFGWLKVSDFFLIPIVGYAVAKELWVKDAITNPEYFLGKTISWSRVFLGEVLFLCFLFILYLACWELFVLDQYRFIRLLKYPQNYIYLMPVIVVGAVLLCLPYYVELYFEEGSKVYKTLIGLSILLPVGALFLVLLRMGGLFSFIG